MCQTRHQFSVHIVQECSELQTVFRTITLYITETLAGMPGKLHQNRLLKIRLATSQFSVFMQVEKLVKWDILYIQFLQVLLHSYKRQR